jgi:molybdopterin synthase catalytic subunit
LIHLKVLYFATLRQIMGLREEQLELAENSRVSDLLNLLRERHADLAPALPSTLVSINREYALPDDTLQDGDEVALFPPVSGGAKPQDETLIRITKQALDMNQVIQDLAVPSSGAVCALTSIPDVRTAEPGSSNHQGQIELTSLIPDSNIQQIVAEIRERWPSIRGIAIVQRVGRMEANTPNLLAACSAESRDADIYHAVQYAIDRLNQTSIS